MKANARLRERKEKLSKELNEVESTLKAVQDELNALPKYPRLTLRVEEEKIVKNFDRLQRLTGKLSNSISPS